MPGGRLHDLRPHPQGRPVEAFVAAGSDILTVHVEAGPHPYRTLQAIQAAGSQAPVGILARAGYSRGGNRFEGMAMLLEQFRDKVPSAGAA